MSSLLSYPRPPPCASVTGAPTRLTRPDAQSLPSVFSPPPRLTSWLTPGHNALSCLGPFLGYLRWLKCPPSSPAIQILHVFLDLTPSCAPASALGPSATAAPTDSGFVPGSPRPAPRDPPARGPAGPGPRLRRHGSSKPRPPRGQPYSALRPAVTQVQTHRNA